MQRVQKVEGVFVAGKRGDGIERKVSLK